MTIEELEFIKATLQENIDNEHDVYLEGENYIDSSELDEVKGIIFRLKKSIDYIDSEISKLRGDGIRWDLVNDKYNWITVDEDNQYLSHITEPVINDYRWDSEDAALLLFKPNIELFNSIPEAHWKQAKFKRPE